MSIIGIVEDHEIDAWLGPIAGEITADQRDVFRRWCKANPAGDWVSGLVVCGLIKPEDAWQSA